MCLKDPYGRIIDYLRVSVTDRCNLNCAYCRPENSPFLSRKALLTSEEILAFCREAAILGIRHIKITGGEPLLRTDCCSIVEKLKKTPGIETELTELISAWIRLTGHATRPSPVQTVFRNC